MHICTFAHQKRMLKLTEELQERVDIIKHKLKFIEQKPAVACIVDLENIALADSTIAQLVSIAGGAADAQLLDPDIIIIMPAGAAIEETIKGIDQLFQLPGFADLKAVKNNRLYITDGQRYFNNDEALLVDEIEILAEIINPKQFIFGYEGNAWIKFSL